MTPAKTRGALNIGFQMAVTIGILADNLINYGTTKIEGDRDGEFYFLKNKRIVRSRNSYYTYESLNSQSLKVTSHTIHLNFLYHYVMR